jgi:hypothetical protein
VILFQERGSWLQTCREKADEVKGGKPVKAIPLVFATLAAVTILTVPGAGQQSAQPGAGERAAVQFERAKLAAAAHEAEKDAAHKSASPAAAQAPQGAAQQGTAGGAAHSAEAQAIRFERAKLQASEAEQKKVEASQSARKAGQHAVTAVNRP